MNEVIGSIIVITIVLIGIYFIHQETITVKELSLHQARSFLRTGKIRSVVDVRSPSEFQAGHYKDAISFPLHTINAQTVQRKEISERMYSPTLVYCKSGSRAKVGAELLHKYGIKTVYYVSYPYYKL